MKIAPPPGVFTDQPPMSAEPFWYRSENVRFRLGQPQTVGLHARFLDRRTGAPVDEQLDGLLVDTAQVDLYADDNLLLIASGRQIAIIRWAAGDIEVRTVDGLGPTGRWWFGVTEENIIAGRSNLECRAVAINRETRAISTIPNIPKGSIAGDVYAGVLILAGTSSYAVGRPAMTVRWSARRTDPSSSGTAEGPFGFEDWVPSDLNASGEFEILNGSAIKAAGTTIFGFMVWTDTAAYQITARTDVNVFSETQVSSRGILGPQTWIVADDRLWWFDQTRTLNMFDGGRPGQIVCPIRHDTLEYLRDDDAESLSLSSDIENGEISLHYPDRDGEMRELVYNYRENVWYTFRLNRLNMVSANGPRPAIGMEMSGRLMFYDIREIKDGAVPRPALERPAFQQGDQPFQPASTPEPFDYHLETNWMTAGNAATQSLRSRNVVVSHTFASGEYDDATDARMAVSIRSYGQLDLRETPTLDTSERPVGQMLHHLRAGGKAIQLAVSGVEQRAFVRFGEIDDEADEAGKR